MQIKSYPFLTYFAKTNYQSNSNLESILISSVQEQVTINCVQNCPRCVRSLEGLVHCSYEIAPLTCYQYVQFRS